MAWVLLVTAVSPLALAYGSRQTSQQKPAGCHERGQKVPAPGSDRYQCCRAGHQFAAVRETVDLRSRILRWCPVVEFTAPAFSIVVYSIQSKPGVFDSPGVTSLRI